MFGHSMWHLRIALLVLCFTLIAYASVGDRLPEFRECVEVRVDSRKILSWLIFLDMQS